jgi:hypothetical protein
MTGGADCIACNCCKIVPDNSSRSIQGPASCLVHPTAMAACRPLLPVPAAVSAAHVLQFDAAILNFRVTCKLTSWGLGATAEDAGHAAHECGLATACIRQGNTVRSRAFVGLRCRIQQRQLLSVCQGARSVLRSMQAPALAPAHSRGSAALDHLPLSAARPTTMVLPSLAFTTRARLDTAACKHRNKAASRDRGVPAALHRPTPSRHRLCYSCRVCV